MKNTKVPKEHNELFLHFLFKKFGSDIAHKDALFYPTFLLSNQNYLRGDTGFRDKEIVKKPILKTVF